MRRHLSKITVAMGFFDNQYQSGERSLQIIRTIDCHWIQRLAATARYCTKVQ
jgi:hypothetical protein